MRLGHFDDVDMAWLIHTTSRPEDELAGVAVSNNGCVVKTIRYMGRAAHAGCGPHLGINTLYAASIALSAINALREIFHERDTGFDYGVGHSGCLCVRQKHLST
jgi:metal-dependent amidase/aminoacylase/carboxypeptidase family protein